MNVPPLVAGGVLVFFLAFAFSVGAARAQEAGHAERAYSGNVHLTNNGISQIPSFTLGKPAVQFDIKIGRKRLTFEPEIRFSTTGRPWDFVSRWQYRVMQTDKFRLRVAFNSVLNFVTSSVIEDGDERDAIIARRFIGGQILPEYSLTKKLSAGLLYLYGRGVEESTLLNLNFIVFNTRLSDIVAFDGWSVSLNAQVYSLIIDDESGTYFSPSVALAKKGFPFSLSAIANKSLSTEISGESFLWSASVIYSY